jgi:hypothetical protein
VALHINIEPAAQNAQTSNQLQKEQKNQQILHKGIHFQRTQQEGAQTAQTECRQTTQGGSSQTIHEG